MKINKLTVSAFGPYRGEETIDFSRLNDGGLVLITGETGAGKTSIFDAIAFALFGIPSGESRNGDMLRCQEATPESKTYVELEFEYKGEKYKIHRNPKYTRPSKRGDSTTTEEAAAILECRGRILSRITDVNSEIESILGLTKDQYKKIGMLAQGEFRKLLLSSTVEKREIFRKLFSTELYQGLQDKIKEESYNAKHDAETESKALIAALDTTPGLAAFAESRENAMEHVKVLLSERKDIMNKTQKDYDEASASNEEAIRNIEKANEIAKTKTALEENREKLKSHAQKVMIARTKLQELTQEDLSSKEERMSFLRHGIDYIKEKEALVLKQGMLEKQKDELAKEIKAKKEQCRKLEESIYKDSAALSALESNKKNTDDILLTINSLESKKMRVSTILSKMNELDDLCKSIEDTNQKYQKAKADYLKAQDAYSRAKIVWEENQAGILAESLEEGSPCPVCGSLHHPHKAEKREAVLSKEDLNNLEDKYSKANTTMISLRTSHLEKSKEKESKKDEISSLIKEFGLDADEQAEERIESLYSNIADEILKNKSIYDAENKKENERKDLANKIGKNNESLRLKQDEIKDKENLLTGCNNEYDSNNGKISSFSARYGDISYAEAQKEIEELTSYLEKAKEERDYADSVCRQAEDEKRVLEALIKDNEEKLRSAPSISIEEEQRKQYDAKLKMHECNEKKSTVNREIDNLNLLYESLPSLYERKAEAIEKSNRINSLSNLLNGNVSGENKISLEAFVQSYYYDRILYRASNRLMKMTNGRYELKRKEELARKSDKSLETIVIDRYNDTERDVKTLSGGEMFLASLSLALGLSDEIESNASSIEMNTLFIDEGFGSLDGDTLSMAMNALSELSEQNKLIAIISHVEQLKTSIDRKIIVRKDGERGSRTELVI